MRRWGDARATPEHGQHAAGHADELAGRGRFPHIANNPLSTTLPRCASTASNFYPMHQSWIGPTAGVLRGELDMDACPSSRAGSPSCAPTRLGALRALPSLPGDHVSDLQPPDPGRRGSARRQALSMAIDRVFLADKLLGAGQVPTTAFVPLHRRLCARRRASACALGRPESPRPPGRGALLGGGRLDAGHPLKLMIEQFHFGATAISCRNPSSRTWKASASRRASSRKTARRAEVLRSIRDFQIGTVAWIAD